MAEQRGAVPDVAELEAALSAMRAIALAQSRWREVAAAIEASQPLPLDDLTPELEKVVASLQLRQLSPRSREQVREHIATMESTLRHRQEELRALEPGHPSESDDERADGTDRPTASTTARWFHVEPDSGRMVMATYGADRAPQHPRPRSDRHEIRLMNDYAARWPLWPATTDVTVEIARYLDDELVARLRVWARTFNDHYSHVSGWDDRDVAAEHRAEGERLLTALQAVIPPPWHVRLDYWETNGA